jgi:lipopolysaccharide/colanic/teichoic acid biosynthesis glycosyltransferase
MATIPITDDSMVMSASVERDLARIMPACSRHVAVLEQMHFLHTLCRERKRSERSGRPLLLMTISAAKGVSKKKAKLLASLRHAIAASIRDTDVLGWYEQDRILAVLFTEIGLGDENVPLIASKLESGLQAAIGSQFPSLDISFRVFPDQDDSPRDEDLRNLWFYPDSQGHLDSRTASRVVKRGIDILGSLLLLALLLPVFLAISALIKMTSEGPVLFRHERIGRHGRSFAFLKFRSMYSNNDSTIHQEYVARLIDGKAKRSQAGEGPGVYKLTDDPRVTALGRFLRKTSLDELPQLLNVLRGEMSLVGPRPPLAYEYQRYSAWHRRRVLDVKPGITGLWQVIGRSRTTFDDMVRLDLTYARDWSIWMDVKILCKTPSAVFRADGAY